MGFFESVYTVVRRIPKGKVATYGQIAALCGAPRSARQVGWALHANPYFGDVPCHRVINRKGELCKGFAFGGLDAQRQMLEAEGVQISDNNTVSLEKHLWHPDMQET